MALGGAVRNERKDQARVEFRCSKRQPIVLLMPKKLKGELTYSSSMNLAVLDSPLVGIPTSSHSNMFRVQQLCRLDGSK